MSRVLYDGLVEYDDQVPATASQMAKDVVEFLNWTAEPEMDQRKRMGWKVIAVGTTLFALSVWVKRYASSLSHRTTFLDHRPISRPLPIPPRNATLTTSQIQMVDDQDPQVELFSSHHQIGSLSYAGSTLKDRNSQDGAMR